jgi:hypothetical protein
MQTRGRIHRHRRSSKQWNAGDHQSRLERPQDGVTILAAMHNDKDQAERASTQRSLARALELGQVSHEMHAAWCDGRFDEARGWELYLSALERTSDHEFERQLNRAGS